MKRILVAYFSATGTTSRLAHMLGEIAKGDIFEIVPDIPYSAKDLNWHDQQSRSSKEMADNKSRPAVSRKITAIAPYDPVFLGFPIWWYQAPRIIETFLSQYDFTDKTIIPFATSGGSGLGETVAILKKSAPGAKWHTGKRLSAQTSAQELSEWINSLIKEQA